MPLAGENRLRIINFAFLMTKSSHLLIFLVLSMGMVSCASSGSLGGGPKDTRAPEVIPAQSSVPFALNNRERSFIFTFDEFVEVRDALKQVLVSPPLTYIPAVKARGKQVRFTFNEKEILRENTTYIIQFGEAIRDFTEGNKVLNFKHVFSTGPSIDSLKVSGKITDESKGEPVAGISVLLYDDLRDSAIVESKPFYFTRTDAAGKFLLENIKKDTFRLVAIKDENSNLQYDELSELIAFDDKFISWPDSSTEMRDMVLYKPEISPKYSGYKHKAYGLLGIKWHTEPKEMPVIKLKPTPSSFYTWLKGDSMMVHYHYADVPDSLEIITSEKTIKTAVPDTSDHPATLIGQKLFSPQGTVPGDTLWIEWERPVNNIDTSRIVLTDTSGRVAFKVISVQPKKTGIFALMQARQKYEINLYPGAVRDFYGNTHDTIYQGFATYDTEKLSRLKVKVTGLDSNYQYVITLMKGSKEVTTILVKGKSTALMDVVGLKADTYGIRVIEDLNENGRADGASYWQKRPGEKVALYTMDKLRESWTMETEVDTTKPPATPQNTPGIR